MDLRVPVFGAALAVTVGLCGVGFGAPSAHGAELGVYVTEPVMALAKRYRAHAVRGAISKAMLKAFDDGCRPVRSGGDGRLAKLPADLRLMLARGNRPPDGVKLWGEGARDLVVLAVRRQDRAYRVYASLVDLRSGRPRKVVERRAKLAGRLAGLVLEAVGELRAAMPCPVWRGEIIVTAKETSGGTDGRRKRTGAVEWTVFVRFDGQTPRMTGSYEITLESSECAKVEANVLCTNRRTDGSGFIRAGKGPPSSVTIDRDGRLSIKIGEAIADVGMRVLLCRPGAECRTNRFRSQFVIPGVAAEGRVSQSSTNVIGVAVLADAPNRKKTASWSLTLELD